MTDAEWAPPLLAGVLGNRGNARSRRGNLSGALDDYNAAIVRLPPSSRRTWHLAPGT